MQDDKSAIKYSSPVMPDPGSGPGPALLIRHPVPAWIPDFAGVTIFCVFHCRIKKALPAVCLAVLLLSACASQPLAPPDWTYEKQAIEVNFIAGHNLNFDQGGPHTLLVCLYQLKDPNAFNQLSEDTAGIYKLLECGLFDSAVATAKRIIVHPGQTVNVKLDRAEAAKYVAVGAGYVVLEKSRMIRLYDIPVKVEKKGFFKKTRTAKPDKMKLDLVLGPSQIKQAEPETEKPKKKK